ncbi:hypothetical protein FKM82_024772 [Ascaphus truei]
MMSGMAWRAVYRYKSWSLILRPACQACSSSQISSLERLNHMEEVFSWPLCSLSFFLETEVSFSKSRNVSKNFNRSAGQSVLEVCRVVLAIGTGTDTGSLVLLQPRLR